MTSPVRLIAAAIAAFLFVVDGKGDVAKKVDARTVRIGVYVRDGFDACLQDWLPMAEHLTRTIENTDFVIVPLASREDIYDYLGEKKIDFLLSNAAIYVCAEERFGVSVLAGMTSAADPTGQDCAGSLIRAADRGGLKRVEDVAGARFSAVKPWSLAGWIVQRHALRSRDFDPLRETLVEFQGTHEDVIQSVLDGTADVGAVATDILIRQIESKSLDPKKLYVFNRDGNAVPLTAEVAAFTAGYPDWVFAKAASTPDDLAERVLQSLLQRGRDSGADRTRWGVGWTVPRNYDAVRGVLREVAGPEYAYVDGLTPIVDPALSRVAIGTVIAGSIALVVVLFLAWRRARRRDLRDLEDIKTIRDELNEVRASKHLLETILTKVQCGIDIVDEDNNVVYVAPAIEQRYGAWHGKKCHEYYGHSPKPCAHCTRRAASDAKKDDDSIADSCRVTLQKDSHPIGVPSREGGYGKLLQVPFFDETGRWLYARVHLPREAFENGDEVKEVIAVTV